MNLDRASKSMMRVLFGIISVAALFSLPAAAVTEAQFDKIKSLGHLNGVALHCRFLDETRRMKEVLIKTLPKRRELGLAFDEQTNSSFMKFISDNQSCPDRLKFSHNVDSAIKALEEAF
ncbi:hypothetical protein [Sedimenticola selenatireducens]|uniref:hypothetical protein n=1 Tax=Sedimenticola selenatireducens TaxID=191960 RepID=UPI0012F82B07|nr:hypothetical protein [Sedimenticola selenatireducens]